MISLWRKHSNIILFVIISFLMGLFILFTSEQNVDTHVTIKVKQGDSLWSISEEYAENLGLTTKEVVKLIEKENELYNKTIKTGDVITIPGLQIDKIDEFQIAYE